MNESDTPKTDEVSFYQPSDRMDSLVVEADFARELERELNEALARIKELEDEMEDRALEAKEEYPDE